MVQMGIQGSHEINFVLLHIFISSSSFMPERYKLLHINQLHFMCVKGKNNIGIPKMSLIWKRKQIILLASFSKCSKYLGHLGALCFCLCTSTGWTTWVRLPSYKATLHHCADRRPQGSVDIPFRAISSNWCGISSRMLLTIPEASWEMLQ